MFPRAAVNAQKGPELQEAQPAADCHKAHRGRPTREIFLSPNDGKVMTLVRRSSTYRMRNSGAAFRRSGKRPSLGRMIQRREVNAAGHAKIAIAKRAD
jgi:hypothetical protein